jgi:hypothetical protein
LGGELGGDLRGWVGYWCRRGYVEGMGLTWMGTVL